MQQEPTNNKPIIAAIIDSQNYLYEQLKDQLAIEDKTQYELITLGLALYKLGSECLERANYKPSS
ncbi:MAG: hypothetical protein RM368_18110 [Nostoc sp. DedSLP03]|uniref:hypothetical protein n=1 Tax=Nostoc sp. DedSLP03 TaxID=3075400 RepID=UPI002AD24245|nr:hypothetical protein [Nostoc sp. DedSLP03]MDZ7966864.1 hypothetical protein [Nostoc sp. DedSLP03]